MMSYLWILLLGSLLAASAKADEDVVPKEDADAAPDASPAPDAHTTPEVQKEPKAEEETDHKDENAPSPASEPENADDHHDAAAEKTDAPAVEEPTPAPEDANAATPAEDDVKPTPAHEDAKPTPGDAEPTAHPTDDDAKAGTPEAEAAEPTKEPAADPEVNDPKPEEPTDDGKEEAASSTGATPAPEATPAADPAGTEKEEKTADPTAAPEPTKPAVIEEVPAIKMDSAPEVKSGISLLDALPDANDAGQSRSYGPVHAAEATGDENQVVKEGGSGSIVGILCAIAVAVVAAIVGYFTYQKKKLCFKNRQDADPEAGRKADVAEGQSEPQVLSTLLNSS